MVGNWMNEDALYKESCQHCGKNAGWTLLAGIPGSDQPTVWRCESCGMTDTYTPEPPTRQTITLADRAYPISAEAMGALANAGAEVAAGQIDATDLIVEILTIEGYGEDPNIRKKI